MDLATTANAPIAAAAAARSDMNWLGADGKLNPNCWAYGLSDNNFRSRAINGTIGPHDGSTLIKEAGRTSTRFGVKANHFGQPTSGVETFLKADGTTFTRNIVAGAQVGGGDIWLVMYDQPINYNDVDAALIFPSNAFCYMRPGTLLGLAVMSSFAQPALVAAQMTIGQFNVATSPPVPGPECAVTATGSLTRPVVAGDSGSPVFTVVGGKEVLIGTFHTGGSVGDLASSLADVQATASGMAGSPVTFVTVDLSAYTALSPNISSFTASASTITPGRPVTLLWYTGYTTNISISPGSFTSTSANGSHTFSPTANTTYTLTANGPGGTVTATIPVAVVLAVAVTTFSANLDSTGTIVTLTWNVTGATSVSIVGLGAVPPSGTSIQPAPQVSTIYQLTAINAAGTVVAESLVNVPMTLDVLPNKVSIISPTPLDFWDPATWIDGVAPVSGNGDVVLIPADSHVQLNAAPDDTEFDFYGGPIYVAGECECLQTGWGVYGFGVIVLNGGRWSGGTNLDNIGVTVRAGGTAFTGNADTNAAVYIIEGGGAYIGCRPGNGLYALAGSFVTIAESSGASGQNSFAYVENNVAFHVQSISQNPHSWLIESYSDILLDYTIASDGYSTVFDAILHGTANVTPGYNGTAFFAMRDADFPFPHQTMTYTGDPTSSIVVNGKTLADPAIQLAADQQVVANNANQISTAATLLGVPGTLDVPALQADATAAQLATDQAEVASKANRISDGVVVLGQEGTGVITPADVQGAMAAVPPPIITPLTAAVFTTRNVIQNIEIWTREGASFTWAVTDQSGAPVNLTNRTLALYLYTANAHGNSVSAGSYTAGSGLSVSGNLVSVQFNPNDVATAGSLRYSLWDMTDTAHPLGIKGGVVTVDPAYRP